VSGFASTYLSSVKIKLDPVMAVLLILAPFGAFTLLMLVTSAALSLFVAAAICLAVVTLDAARGRSVKILSAGSGIAFAAIGSYLVLIDPSLSGSAVKLAVDGGILLIALGSMLCRYPFTLQYALEAVPAETAAMPGFRRANYAITGAWALAAILMMAGNLLMIYVPALPFWTGLAIAVAARNSALYFTRWYPDYRKSKDSSHRAGTLTETR
jgi:hypothetical protein